MPFHKTKSFQSLNESVTTSGMRDQETDREGNGLSIIGGPSLELNRSRSSQLSCLGSGIPWRVGGFGSKVIKCGAGSSLSTSSGSREG
ncbi:hypothetical protein Fmac_001573 [Flemingia macrophylla]|uniref:Uncharacterized protein n=1 Tax=Flemingia macrophylla TaxID=520843 RepID=A0ABD1NI97_9FABA